MKLHLGCGRIVYNGWVNIDITNKKADMLDDMSKLSSFKAETIDEIYSSHAIEHIHPFEFRLALKRWYELLKPGGRITLRTPNEENIVKQHPEIININIIPSHLFHKNPSPKHKDDLGYIDRNHFSENSLRNYVANFGFISIETRIVSQRHSVIESFKKYGMDEGIIDHRKLKDIWLRAFKQKG